MKYVNHLYNLENGNICIYPNYRKRIQDKLLFSNILIEELNDIILQNGSENKFIILVDLGRLRITPDYATNNLIFYKNLKKKLEKAFPDKLEKVIIYNYTRATLFFVSVIKLILDKELREKIIVDTNYRQFFDNIINKKPTIAVNNSLSNY